MSLIRDFWTDRDVWFGPFLLLWGLGLIGKGLGLL